MEGGPAWLVLCCLVAHTARHVLTKNTCTYSFTVENAEARCTHVRHMGHLDQAGQNRVVYDKERGYMRDATRRATVVGRRHGGGGGGGGGSADDQAGLSEREVLSQLLVTVNKLLQHQNVLENVKVAHRGISELKEEMHGQHTEYEQMIDRISSLESHLELLTSGRTLLDRDRRSEIFDDFTGKTSRFQGCPLKGSRRIYEMSPIKKRFDELIRVVPRSCSEWRSGGFTQRGFYLIDPDGMEDTPAFTVECRMDGSRGADDGGNGDGGADHPVDAAAIIHHDKEVRAHVTDHDEPGSYNVEVKYHGVDWEQLAALTANSYRCEQFLRWECKGASISRESWWVDRGGEAVPYWAGGQGRGCHCLLNDTCLGGNLCNCDMNKDTEWLADEGYIWQKEHLPVRRLQLGDTGGKNEEGYYTLGPLVCYSNKTNPFGTSNAFMPVEIYKPFNVFCDLEGWIVIARHTVGDPLTFDRDWDDYRKGFGELEGDFWLGLEQVHHLTTQGKEFSLQIVFTNKDNLHYYAQYSHFHVSSEPDGFRLYIGHYTGTSIDALSPSYGQLFSTRDRDNDVWTNGNCAKHATKPPPGGWWYTDCGKVFLLGAKILWASIDDMTRVEMKIRSTAP